jgi:hypothetical protein
MHASLEHQGVEPNRLWLKARLTARGLSGTQEKGARYPICKLSRPRSSVSPSGCPCTASIDRTFLPRNWGNMERSPLPNWEVHRFWILLSQIGSTSNHVSELTKNNPIVSPHTIRVSETGTYWKSHSRFFGIRFCQRKWRFQFWMAYWTSSRTFNFEGR